MFQAACDWAGVTPAATLHVGDDPRRDVAAARALGMRTAWVNRDGAVWPDELPAADLQFTDLAGLTASLMPVSKDAAHDL